ncbi:LPP20 family lipoprotein [Sulfurivirga sp.]|uniref:LPP20 family lipoprotein n=1 Tax=Sulfurivirga sp. TaxID=2614236 RepID=UPI0025DAB44E|nr:LPP20 family lipoprotein [Sulfurivirga sp.]
MKMKHAIAVAGGMGLMALAGCQQTPARQAAPQPKPVVAQVQQAKPQPKPAPVVRKRAPRKPQLIKIVGIGYGSESTYEGYTPGQRRLMAIRASKLDAYRSLAEQLYGIKIDSNTTVSALMARSDSFRARVNAIVRGARVVSVTPLADHNYETILEVYVDKAFFRQNFIYSADGCGADGCYPDEAYRIEEVRCDGRMNCTTARH